MRTNAPHMLSCEFLLYKRQVSNRGMMALGRRGSANGHALSLTQSLQLNRPSACCLPNHFGSYGSLGVWNSSAKKKACCTKESLSDWRCAMGDQKISSPICLCPSYKVAPRGLWRAKKDSANVQLETGWHSSASTHRSKKLRAPYAEISPLCPSS